MRIFPNEASYLRLVRVLAEENHEEWLEAAVRYLDMDVLKEHRKLLFQKGMEPVSDTVACSSAFGGFDGNASLFCEKKNRFRRSN